MFRHLFLFAVAAFAVASAPVALAESEDGHDHPAPSAPSDVFVEPGEAVVRVNGVVCSFCAHGLEKSLSKLDGLDGSQHGNGVLVQVDEQLVRLALLPGTAVPFAEIAKRIRKAGYDPVRFHLRVAGQVAPAGGASTLEGDAPPQVFALSTAAPSGPADLQLRVEAKAVESLAVDAPVPSFVDATP